MLPSPRPLYPSLQTTQAFTSAMERPLSARPLTPSPSNSQSTESTASTTSPQTPLGQAFNSPGVMERKDGMDEAGSKLLLEGSAVQFTNRAPNLLSVSSTSPPPTPPSSSHPPTFTFENSSPQPSSPSRMAAAAVAVLPPSSPSSSSASFQRRRPPPPPLTLNSPKKREHSLDDNPPRPKTPLTGSSISSDASEVTEEKLERLGLAVRGNLRMRPIGQGLDFTDEIVESPISPSETPGRTINHFYPSSSPSPPLQPSINLLSPSSFLVKLSPPSTSSSSITTSSSRPPLIVDLRPLGDFLASRIPTSINIALPSLILKRAITGTWAGASWNSFSGFITTLDGQDRWKEATGPSGLKDGGREIVVIPGDRSGSGEGVRATFEKLNRFAGKENDLVWVLDGGIEGIGSVDHQLLMQGERSVSEEDALLVGHFGGASSPSSSVNSLSKSSISINTSSPSPPLNSTFSQGSPPPSRTRNFPSRSLTLPSPNHPSSTIKPLLSPSAIAHFSQLSPSFSSTSSSASSSSSPGTSDGRRSKPPPLQLDTSSATSPSHPFPGSSSSSSSQSQPNLNHSATDLSNPHSSPDPGKARPPKLSLRTLGTQPAGGPRTLSLEIGKGGDGLQKKASRGLLIQTNLGDRRTSGSGQVNGGSQGSGGGGGNSGGSRTPSQSLFPPSFAQPQTIQSLCHSQSGFPPSPSSFSTNMGDLTRLQPSNGSSSSSSTYYGQPNTPSAGSTFHASPSSSADSSPTSASGPEAFIVSTIIPGFLYLGPDPTTEEEVAQLNEVGIKRILNMAVECDDELRLQERFEVYKKIGMRDSVEEMGVAKGLKEGCAFLDDARLHSAPTYVHCRAGKSRSVTVVLAYLIQSHRWALNKAYAYVLERRKGISPNIGFMAELLNVEAELGRASSPGEGSSAQGAGRVRESLPPDWTLNSGGTGGLGEHDEDSALLGMGMGTAGEGMHDEMEVRRNGQFHHKSRPPVDTTTLQPLRRVSKAGLEGVSSMNWESGRRPTDESHSSSSNGNDVEMKSPTPRSPNTPTAMSGILSRDGWV